MEQSLTKVTLLYNALSTPGSYAYLYNFRQRTISTHTASYTPHTPPPSGTKERTSSFAHFLSTKMKVNICIAHPKTTKTKYIMANV